ncbi:hypothetical protein AALB39_27940 [Lachnospiraceae bacterium 54-53]
MKSERLYQAIGNADNEIMDQYENSSKKTKPYRMKLGALAACLCLAVVGVLTMNGQFGTADQFYKASGIVIDSFPSDSVSGMYAAPDNGEKVYFTEVTNALQKYAGQNVTFFLRIDIFTNQAKLDEEIEAAKAELERLSQLGYHVGYSRLWTYEGEGKQVDKTYISGYFTGEELEKFAADENYGYMFSFAQNGDGSAVPADQGIITDFDSEVK